MAASSFSLPALLAAALCAVGCANGGGGSEAGASAGRPGFGTAGRSPTEPGGPSLGEGRLPLPGTRDPGTGPDADARDPGRVTMRRLTRAEYDNTVRDLLGTAQTPGRTFLNDSPDLGFDNNADLLSMSPAQADLYRRAAESLAEEALAAPLRDGIVTCDLAEPDCVPAIVTELGGRAYRRPLEPAEISAYTALFERAVAASATPDEALRTVLEAILISPHFLFRVEIDPDPSSPTPHAVAPYEMATRLSYLIYASMPDAPLFEAAAEGRLADSDALIEQVERMLEDRKGRGFTESFALQWLGLRVLGGWAPDAAMFPSYGPALADSMQAEVRGFFDEFVRDDRPLAELLTANFTYLDRNLSSHYALPDPGAALTRVVLDTPERGGLLGMAGPLTVTSAPTRTSVVRRGAWVLSTLLCATPPPPPPNVESLNEEPASGTTQRDLLAEHRRDPSCASCHTSMDNIGLALENYDGIGAYRELDNGAPIDARGELDGVSFDGPRELSALLAQDPRLGSCLARKVMTYALGRSLGASDAPYLADIGAGPELGVRELVRRVVQSEPFRYRRGEPEGGTP